MQKLRFAMIGGGWRSEFYLRVAKALPELFEVTGVWMRDPKKSAVYAEKYGIRCCENVDALIDTAPDFVVVSLSWEPAFICNMQMVFRGIPTLTETPAAPNLDALNSLWEEVQKRNVRFLCGEAYHLQPFYCAAAWIAEKGIIGERQSLSLSMMHGYHAINIARRLLGVGIGHAEFCGTRLKSQIIQTCDRNGAICDGRRIDSSRDLVLVKFENGKSFLYDFCDEQYFSLIRSRFLQLNGSHGELFMNRIRAFHNGSCTEEALQRVDFYGEGNLVGIAHRGYTFRGEWIYENPFPSAALTDDELSVASRLVEMGDYLKTGKSSYSLRDACQDAYLSLLMTEAADSGKTVLTQSQAWFS